MNKAAIASLLALSAFTVAPALVSHQGAAYAQAPAGQVQMDAAEFADYDNAMNKQTTPQTQAPALEAYLAKYPKSSVRTDVLQRIMLDYSQFDPAKALTAADNFLAVAPTNLQAYVIEVAYRKQMAEDPKTDAAAKTADLDAAASYAKKGLEATKAPAPAGVTADQQKAIVAFATPTFYSAIGEAALNNKDSAGAIAAYTSELASMKPEALSQPAALQEAFYLAQAYRVATPPDYINCTFYATRAAALAPDQFKAQLQPLADYCYKKFHGSKDGYDAIVAIAKSNATPPADFNTKITPAPTDADQANALMASTKDDEIAKLATGDKEYVLQYASAANAEKVWNAMKGKAVQIPGALVIESSPTSVKVAVSEGAVQDKKADFTFNLKPLVAPEEPKAKTPAALAAYKKAKAAYDKEVADDAAAVAVGKTVTLSGTYDSYTPNPMMIIMNDGEITLPKAAPAPKAPVHAAPHRK